MRRRGNAGYRLLALDSMRQQLRAALYSEMAVEGCHVLMGGGVADAEAIRHLLLAIALQ